MIEDKNGLERGTLGSHIDAEEAGKYLGPGADNPIDPDEAKDDIHAQMMANLITDDGHEPRYASIKWEMCKLSCANCDTFLRGSRTNCLFSAGK